MNIVILTGPYFPNMCPSSTCIDKYVQYLKNKYQIHIICQRSSYVDEEKYCVGNVQLHYVSNRVNNLRNWCTWNIREKRIYHLSKALLLLIRAYGVFISYFVYPTRLSWLIDKYYNELCKLERVTHIDVIISVSNPVCTHLAVLKFKKEFVRSRWITYNTDPFTYYTKSYSTVINKQKRKKLNYKIESQYYEAADYNIFTEELFYSAIHDFKICKKKCICFPYVFSDFKFLNKTLFSNNELSVCKLVYAGSLNKEIRNPEYALSVLRNVSGIELCLYQAGDCNDIISRYSSPHIKVYDLLKRDQYVNLICNEADILVNIANNSNLQAPSKLLELLSTGKPVINFYYHKNSQYKMIEKYPLGLNIGRNDMCAVEKVQNFCKEFRGKLMNIEALKGLFPENNIDNHLKVLESLF